MANCSKLFIEFSEELEITSSKKDSLIRARVNLRSKIQKYFKANHPEYVPKFFIQGSYKIGTMIRTKDDSCDLDDGVFFSIIPDVTGTTLQLWIKAAVEGTTNAVPVLKEKCVRVEYANGYHIDLPIFYKTHSMPHPKLAVKNSDFVETDPKEFIEWFNNLKDVDGQLKRIIKYLKAWCDNIRHKLPNGLTMTILAARFFKDYSRDDEALRDILIEIKSKLNTKWECKIPTIPFDDLLEDYNDARKNNFLLALDKFIEDANLAIDKEDNQLKSSKLWRKHLGVRFPLGIDES